MVTGRHRWVRSAAFLDCGNSGTTARLAMGILAGQAVRATLTGDRSLRKRPMRRVTEPLARMGARFDPPEADRLPITIQGGGGRLEGIRWELPVSSAQLKSAILLAGLVGKVPVAIREPAGLSRDHTERMFRGLGQRVVTANGWIEFSPGADLAPFDVQVPGDVSSAAFLIGAATLGTLGQLELQHVGLNPTRTGFLDVLARMGGRLERRVEGETLGEPVGTIVAQAADLGPVVVTPSEVPGLIDEIPMLAVLAARAAGTSRFEEVGELRVKESDRLSLIAENLRNLGYEALVDGDLLVVRGSDHPPRGKVRTEGDHRLAMAFGVLGQVPGARIAIDDRVCADVSFPGFFEQLVRLRRRR